MNPQQQIEPPGILLIDLSPTIVSFFEEVLESLDMHTFCTHSSAESLQITEQKELALILLNLEDSSIDGLATAEKLRASERGRIVPIIFLTSVDKEQNYLFQGYESGAVDYLFFPLNPLIVQSKIQIFIDFYFQKQQLAESVSILKDINEQLRESVEIIQEQQDQINYELDEARNTQKNLLPHKLPDIPDMKIACKFTPMAQIGGDLYNIFPLDEQRFGIMIMDVTGHGVPAALLSFMISAMFASNANINRDPRDVAMGTNGALEGKLEDEKFASMFYGVYDAKTKVITYANAGHPPGLILRPSTNEIFECCITGSLIGAFSNNIAKYDQQTFAFKPGDRFFLYTDGIIETKNKEGKMLKRAGLKSFLLENSQSSVEEILNAIYEFLHEYSEASDFSDDITLIGLQID
ncbi:MAG: SpoIIE family protein phosphatase [SAR324 cluster bacterium]|nr:SpoIIE family protein phosphatase [SAR324 cluster bacterium]